MTRDEDARALAQRDCVPRHMGHGPSFDDCTRPRQVMFGSWQGHLDTSHGPFEVALRNRIVILPLDKQIIELCHVIDDETGFNDVAEKESQALSVPVYAQLGDL